MLKDVQVYVVGKVFKPNGMKVLALNRTRGTSKACHRCGHVAREHGREMRCLKCGLRYNRDLNACINIAHVLTRDMGWGSRKPPKPADVTGGAKPSGERWKPQGRGRSHLTTHSIH